MKDGISIVIPSYQEAENLKNILPLCHAAIKDISVPYEIICVDTMEPLDNTETVCQECSARYIKRTGGNDYGDAIRTGFSAAQYSYTVVMDGDGSHDPKYIRAFYEAIQEGHDLIIGSRYIKGGGTQNPFVLKAMSYILNVTYRILFGINAKDISDSYRMYRTKQIQGLTLECQNFDIVEELIIKLALSKKNYDIKEVPIYFEEREYGTSKRKLGKFVLSYLRTIKKLKRIQREHKSK